TRKAKLSFSARALLAAILVPVGCMSAAAEDVLVCNPGEHVTVSAMIDRVNPPDGKFPGSFAFKGAVEPCVVFFIYYEGDRAPAGCEPGKTITASGVVSDLDETGSVASPIIAAPESISCN